MAANVELNAGSGGDTIRTLDRSGVETPVSVIDVGGTSAESLLGDSGVFMPITGAAAENAAVAGSPILVGGRYDASPRTLGDGDVGAAAMDADGAIHISDGGNTITVDGTVTAALSATDNAVLDQVEVNTSYGDQTGGGVEASALRVTIASDCTGVLTVDDGGGSLTVDLATLPDTAAGDLAAINTAVSGTLTVGSHAVTNAGTFATQATVANAHTADYDSGGGTDTTTAFGLAVPASGGAAVITGDAANGLDVDVTRVGGTVTVDGSASTQPVSAASLPLPTGAATQSTLATIDTDTGNIATSTSTIAGAVSGSEMQVDVVTSGLPTGAATEATLGTIDTDTGNIAAGYAAEGAALGSGVLVQGDDGTDRTNILVDTDGHLQVDVLTGGGAGTQYTEDAAAAANPTGNMPVLVRADTPGATTSTDGDVVAQRATNYGAAYCQILDSSGNFIDTFGGSGGTATTDDGAFVAGTGQGTPAMGFFSADTVDSGDVGVLAMDASRRLLVSIEADNVGIGGGTQYTEDAAAAANPVGNAMMVIREDARAGSLTTADGDNVALRGNNSGELYVIDTDAKALLTTIDADTGSIDGKITACNTGAVVISSGTVTAALSATDNAVLDQIEVNTSYGDSVGGGTEAAALRVTLANDSTGVVTVDDGGGSLTVDSADLSTIAGDTTSIDGKITACNTGAVVVSSGAITIDGSAVVKAEDAVHGSGDTGIMALAVRNDTLAALAGTDGDYSPLQVSATGALYVTGGGGGTEYDEDAATPATITGTATMVERDDALAEVTPVEGDWIGLRGTAEGALWVQDFNSDGLLADTNTMAAAFATEGSALGSGVLLQGDDGTDRQNVLVDVNGHLQVDVLTGAGTEYSEGNTASTITGKAILWEDSGDTLRAVSAAKPLPTDVISALPAGTNAIGKLAANSGVDIGDVDVTSQPARDRLTDNVGVALQTDVILSDTTALTPKYEVIDDASSGNNTIVAAVADKKIRVLQMFLVAAGDVVVRWEDGAGGTALTGQMDLTTNSGFVLPFSPVGWFETSSNTLLNLELDGAVSVDGCLVYVEV